jgi:diguanylate cyclase (GGDEF)-like protein
MKLIQFPRFNYQQIREGKMDILEQSLARQALDESPMGVIITDTDQRIAWTNKTMQGFLNRSVDSLLGEPLQQLSQEFSQTVEGSAPLWRIPAGKQSHDRWLLQVDKQISNGISALYFADSSELIRLRTEVQHLNDQLESTATNDPVTGVLNRRALLQGLEPQVSRSRRYENPLSIIIMQINGFDTGSEAVAAVTEHVLRGLGFYLRDQLRWVDLVGRTADDEFTLVLPETTKQDATVIAHKINERIQDLSLPDTPNVTVKVEAKLGITEWQKGDDTTKLLKRAQSAVEEWAETA